MPSCAVKNCCFLEKQSVTIVLRDAHDEYRMKMKRMKLRILNLLNVLLAEIMCIQILGGFFLSIRRYVQCNYFWHYVNAFAIKL